MKKIFLLALVFSLLTGGLFFSYLRSLDQGAEAEYESVVVAAVDMPPLTTITADMVSLTQVPLGGRHPAAAHSVEEVIGLVTDDHILTGEQMIPSKLKTPGNIEDGLTFAIEPGYRAVSILIAEDTGVAYYPKPGDYVDVLSVVSDPLPDPNSRDRTAAYLVVEDVRILAMGRASSEEGETPQTVTLMVKPEQAMSFALTSERFVLVLRGVGDHGTTDPKYAWNSTLLPEGAWRSVVTP
ncbi:exported hypothetical protein [uncultured Eubacteriales bacterium]|uniref:SAF domain-containing protein n=1 Tax=uncultured Eubacteriales bacterium TaxID=172733 RepID=A0A212JE35_9FIRM|nr:exported hypothetical protein [uncultured Eubacteriales bacterium]